VNYTSPHYDNDEVMANLGRTLGDMLIGQRQKGSDDDTIAPTLLRTVADYVEEDEPDDDERDDGDQGDDTPEGPDSP
jgi:hypothetical protein